MGTCVINEIVIINEEDVADLREKGVLVYDIGGSHVSAAVCVCSDYHLEQFVREGFPQEQSSTAFLKLISELGTKATAGRPGVMGAALAVPGPFDYQAGTSLMTHKLPYINGVALRAPFLDNFGWQASQVRFLGDACAFLLGEIGAGVAQAVPRVVGIALGTGIGSAFAMNGHVVTEGVGVAPLGEIWDLPFECGIIEDYVSTRAIQRNYQRLTGRNLEVIEIAGLALTDPDAAAVFVEFGHQLGRALRSAVADFKPDLVVLGGGISRSSHLFLETARAELADLSFPLRISTLLDHAPLVGAAVAWLNGSSK